MAELIAGAFLSSFFQFAFERLASKDFKDLFHNKGLLKKLEITLNSINQLLDDAETKQYQNSHVKNWLDEVKHEVYEVDHLLDEIALEQRKSKAKRFFSTLTNPFESRIKDLLGNLNFLAEQKDVLGLTQRSCTSYDGAVGPQFSKIIPTASLVDESSICGREGEKEEIINYLLSTNDNDKQVSVISIVGLGGMGKTTLAQLVYKDQRIEKRFEHKAWVHVPKTFDVVGLAKTILRSFDSSAEGEDLDPLLCRLQQTLTSKKFLLVLDDVWTGNEECWERLLLPLNSGSSESKIVVTTRETHVASFMKSDHQVPLQQLEQKDCWSLFVKHAFRGKNEFEYQELESIGKKILDKCGGLPLAVKTMGNLLQIKFSRDEWCKILEADMWHVSEGDDKINSVLRLSYHNLSSNLKRCFAFCSIFFKGYKFQKDQLIKLWMAEGLLKCSGRDKREEELGNKFFDDLESISFFQQFMNDKTRFVMHDLVNDLAKSESLKFCLQIDEGDKVQDICERTRHIWCSLDLKDDASVSKQICKIKGLRGMFIERRFFYSKDIMVSNNLQRDIFSKLKYLRMLSFRGCELIELSDKIGNLKLLRYLDLTRTQIKTLPNSICELYNLETLILEGTNIKKMPKKIGRLNHLQTLSHFVVAEKRECDIKELDNLNLLQGKLYLSGLKHVINPAEAPKANMKDKKHLEELIMQFSDSFEVINNGSELDVLEALEPNSNLKKLSIKNYNGNRFPNWLRDCDLPNLVSLKLKGCGLCSQLLPLGQLPSLKELSISHCLELKRIPPQHLPSLQTVVIYECNKLEECLCLEGSPLLKELYISKCPELKRIPPQHLPSLQKLVISDCNKLEECLCLEGSPLLKEVYIRECPELKRIPPQHLPSLQKLEISDCNKLEECLCLEGSPLLENVSIKRCSKLKRAPLPQHLPSLQILKIDNCKMLEASIPKGDSMIELVLLRCDRILVNELPTSLKKFVLLGNRYVEFSDEQNLVNCTVLEELEFDLKGIEISRSLDLRCYNSLHSLSIKGWDSLPFSLHLFTNLRYLYLYDCPQLESFPIGGLPSNLRQLKISNCPKLIGSREEWGLFQLNSLEYVLVRDAEFENVESFPEENLLPPTLQTLWLSNCSKLRIMNNKGFLHLNSLKYLDIDNCPSLESLPEEGLLNLNVLFIEKCPLIWEKYKKEGGERWHTIRHIPNVWIDSIEQHR
ncbi:putative disease resistance RPP13-like protein 1 isoform X4 [Trifolium pratense]|uniref:putative disease resistance RPP13-like protein 1 isoform X4 n=1 Tax=Trifolium pratense TaxID=57577 RepID=UPI001E6950E0|nr:putative disease resistance RPP13-like protein 1 isoform X4 [Trifolium pratense]